MPVGSRSWVLGVVCRSVRVRDFRLDVYTVLFVGFYMLCSVSCWCWIVVCVLSLVVFLSCVGVPQVLRGAVIFWC